MFKLFEKQITAAMQSIAARKKSTNELIDEIHESFYTEVDRLLAEAKITNSLHSDKQHLIDKRDRLVCLGFTNTKEFHEASNELARLQALKSENAKKQALVEAINYFNMKYPNYKFITEDSVKKICQKYNLVYGTVYRYTGTVPDKNLAHMEAFKVDKQDMCYSVRNIFDGVDKIVGFEQTTEPKRNSSPFEDLNDIFYSSRAFSSMMSRVYGMDTKPRTLVCPLEIAAPAKDFNLSNAEIKNFKITKVHIPDPVVLQPVFFKGEKYYLIVTAWGQEASDELVVNHKMN